VAKRSPLNQRYSKYGEPTGKTRKSAASAKPKRSTGDSPAESSGSKGGAKRTFAVPDTPEYKRLRKTWWWLLGGGMLLVGLSFLVQYQFQNVRAATALSWMALAVIGVAYYLDFKRIRPLRQAALRGEVPVKQAGEKGADKAAKTETSDKAADKADKDAGGGSDES